MAPYLSMFDLDADGTQDLSRARSFGLGAFLRRASFYETIHMSHGFGLVREERERERHTQSEERERHTHTQSEERERHTHTE